MFSVHGQMFLELHQTFCPDNLGSWWEANKTWSSIIWRDTLELSDPDKMSTREVIFLLELKSASTQI